MGFCPAQEEWRGNADLRLVVALGTIQRFNKSQRNSPKLRNCVIGMGENKWKKWKRSKKGSVILWSRYVDAARCLQI